MMLFGGGDAARQGLLVSLPGAELAAMELSGSVVEPHEVLAAPVSFDLRCALHLVVAAAAAAGVAVRCVARPELFGGGVAADWLRRRTADAGQHLCLSDGTSLKTLPWMGNHVFFYSRATVDPVAAAARLARRAPELMAQIATQVNSSFSLGHGVYRAHPRPVYLRAAAVLERPRPTLWPAFLNLDSVEDTAAVIAHRGPVLAESIIAEGGAGLSQLRYLPLTRLALDDRAFARAVATILVEACFSPATLLVVRLPLPRAPCDPREALREGIHAMLPAIRDTGVVVPPIAAPNVLFATQDLEEGHKLLERYPYQILVHDSYDFWRNGFGFYARAARVTALSGADATDELAYLPCDVSDIYGPSGVRAWLGSRALA